MACVWERIRPWLFPVWCSGCGADGVALCAACLAAAAPAGDVLVGTIRVRAARSYAGVVVGAVLAMKRGERAYLDALAAAIAPLIVPGSTLVPAVTVRVRAAERGFDQARELGRRAAALRGAAVADVLVKRGRPQRGLGRRERLAMRGRFEVRAGVALPARATLIDDVVTTGATLAAAVAALASAGCRVEGAVVVAATPGETPDRAAESVGR